MNKLPDEQIILITKTVDQIIDKKNRRTKKEEKDYRLRNTSLLLKNYRLLRVHCDSIVEDLTVYEEFTYDAAELDLKVLMKYKARTAKMLKYFEFVFKSYGEIAAVEGEAFKRRYNVVNHLYVSASKLTADELAEKYTMDRSTVFRDVKRAINELSIMLFGIDSFDDLEEMQ